MMTLLSQHEATGSRQGVETRLGKRLQLHLAVTVRKCREHEERNPVGRLFVKRPENSWLVLISGTSLQQGFRFLTTVSTKIPLKQVNHGPKMAPLLNIHLKEITHVI